MRYREIVRTLGRPPTGPLCKRQFLGQDRWGGSTLKFKHKQTNQAGVLGIQQAPVDIAPAVPLSQLQLFVFHFPPFFFVSPNARGVAAVAAAAALQLIRQVSYIYIRRLTSRRRLFASKLALLLKLPLLRCSKHRGVRYRRDCRPDGMRVKQRS